MECPKDCPILIGNNKTIASMFAEIEHTEAVSLQHQATVEQNQAIARQLAALPPTPEIAEARGLLQEAVLAAGSAQAQLSESIVLSNTAIEANRSANDIIFSNCLGEPNYIDDPSRPGNMILVCASPGVYTSD